MAEDTSKVFPLNVDKEKIMEKKEEETVDLGFLKKPFFWQITSVLFIILFIISLFSIFGDNAVTGAAVADIGATEVHAKVKDYVDTILRGQVTATLSDPVEEAGMYQIDVSIQGQTITSYVTKDGKLFFPTVVDLDEFKALGGVPQIARNVPPPTADDVEIVVKDASDEEEATDDADEEETTDVTSEETDEEA